MAHPARRRLRRALRIALATAAALGCGQLRTPDAAVSSADFALVLGDSSYVDLGDFGDAFDLVPGGERTFMLWIRATRPRFHAKILNKAAPVHGSPGFAAFLHIYNGTLGVWIDSGDPVDPSGYTRDGAAGLRRIDDGRWHHIAIVQGDTVLRAYVDGRPDLILSLARSIGGIANDEPLWLGWSEADFIRFAGEMDELSIWHRALSRREVRAYMYRSPAGTEDGLVAYWPMDEGAGATLRDRGPHGRHGRVHGASWAPSSRPRGPPFRETVLFHALLAALAAALLYGSMRLYAMRIRRQNRRLERQVGERTAELAAAHAETARALDMVEAQARRLSELDEAKNRFFTNISHEFRTPLALIVGPLSDVRDGRLGEVSPAVAEQVGGALHNSRRLLRLTSQLLDLARLESGALELTVYRLDLCALLDGLAVAFAPAAEASRLRFERDLPPGPIRVYGDPERLETVFANLLSNAVKFTPAGGLVRVSTIVTDGHAAVRVEDTGPGIPARDLPRIFDRFYQSALGERQGQGTGIGLALARELTELHGGSISAHSRDGAGSTFTVVFRLGRAHFLGLPHIAAVHDEPPPRAPADLTARGFGPAQRPPSAAAAGTADGDAPADAGDEADRPVVLVVDDNAEIRAYVRAHFDGAYRVEEAADGAAALDRARVRVPDLIVSDVMMPGMDGLELLRAVRADPDLSFVPVILLTARAEMEDRLEGLGAGADDYLTKPFEPAELAARVANLIAQRHRLRDRLREAEATRADADGRPEAPGTRTASLEARLRAALAARIGDEDFGVDALAAAVHMERTGLYRHMMDAMRTTPSDFLREARLARAAELLRDEQSTVAEVAYAVGYRSVSSFSRRFRERFGCSPAAYAARRATT